MMRDPLLNWCTDTGLLWYLPAYRFRRWDSSCSFIGCSEKCLGWTHARTVRTWVRRPVRTFRWRCVPTACSNKPSCSTCAGEGAIVCPVCTGTGVLGRTITCPYCKGRKRIVCPVCVVDPYEATWTAEAAEHDDDNDNEAELEAFLPPDADARVRALYRSHLEALRRERGDEDQPGA